MTPRSILVVEDETILRDLMAKTLVDSGNVVHTAGNGKEAWDALQELKPDIILLDLLMPLVTGYELLGKLRSDERFKTTPCLVLSNSGQIDDLNRAFALGATDVLIKANFNPEQLILKVEQILQKQKEATI